MKLLLVLLFPIFAFGVVNPPDHKSHAPIISGDAFREYADLVFDESNNIFNPESVTPYSTVFVQTDMLHSFFSQIHPHISCKYILITQTSDDSIPGKYYPYLEDEKLIAWFGINYDGYPHLKIHPIPLGIPCSWVHWNTWTPFDNGDILKKVRNKKLSKNHLIYMNFTVSSFPSEREELIHFFSRKRFCYCAERKPYEDFLIDIASSKFCFSPRGIGLDTHRLWESLYLDTIPIVKTSSLDSLYADLPVLIVPNWDIVTKQFLKKKYQEIKSKTYNLEKLYTNYWFRLIDSYKKEQ